jgi:hypothetical protein
MSNAQSRGFLWILLLGLMVLTAIVASATTLEPMSFATLTQRATRIAHLRCVAVRSVWDRGEIWTESRFAVLSEEKPDVLAADAVRAVASGGDRAEELSVRMLGGRVNDVRSHVDGVPEFRVGEEVYLFLWRWDGGEPYRVLGWTQGTFRVTRDVRTGEARVTQDSSGAVVGGAAIAGVERASRNSGIRGMRVGAFEGKLREALSGNAR